MSAVPSVAVGFHVYRTCEPAFTYSLGEALLADRGRAVRELIVKQTSVLADARNRIAEDFLATGCEYLWLLDCDVFFPVDALPRLVAAAGGGERTIVAGHYWAERPGRSRSTWSLRFPDDTYHPLAEVPDEGLLPIDGCGMGCTLVHRSALEAVAHAHADPTDDWVWFGHDLTPGGRLGEDQTLCRRAAEVGHRAWGLASLRVGHVKPQAVPEAPPLAA